MPSISLLDTYKNGGFHSLFRRVHDGLIYRYHRNYNLKFDTRYAIDTEASVRLEELDFQHVNKSKGVDYEATPTKIVQALVKSVSVPRESTTFVDLGCGKGRVLITGILLGFADVIGIEFAENIAAIADKNLRAVFADKPASTWSIENIDATAFTPPQKDLLIFLYNPFDANVLSGVTNWMKHHAAKGHKIHIIYYNPQHADVLDAQPFLQPIKLPIAMRVKLSLTSWHSVRLYRSI